jgi:pyridoxamine 5'-phosphate oxidase family protein
VDVPEVELIVDDLASIEPWQPRGVEISGAAEALTAPPRIRIRPDAVRSWGL